MSMGAQFFSFTEDATPEFSKWDVTSEWIRFQANQAQFIGRLEERIEMLENRLKNSENDWISNNYKTKVMSDSIQEIVDSVNQLSVSVAFLMKLEEQRATEQEAWLKLSWWKRFWYKLRLK